MRCKKCHRELIYNFIKNNTYKSNCECGNQNIIKNELKLLRFEGVRWV